MSDAEEEEDGGKPKALPNRRNRGIRLSDLHGEGDDEFWSQDYWQEKDESDGDYEVESEEEDVVDSDFFDTEDESDEGEVVVPKEKDGKKNVYVDKQKAAPKRQRVPPAPKVAAPKVKPAPVEAEPLVQTRLPGTQRQSARTATQANTVAAKEAALARASKPVQSRVKTERKQWTQAERMQEAMRTEILNRKSLEDLLRLEELNKKKAAPIREFQAGPVTIFHTKNGRNTLTFANTKTGNVSNNKLDAWPAIFKQGVGAEPARETCIVTNLPARYRDPVTGIAYANVEALRVIREYCRQQEEKSGAFNDEKLKRNISNSAPSPTTPTPVSDSFQQLSMRDHQQLQLQLLHQQQQHLQELQQPHNLQRHLDANANVTGPPTPSELSAMQLASQYPYSYPPGYSYDPTFAQAPSNSGLAHNEYYQQQLQLQLQQMQQYTPQ